MIRKTSLLVIAIILLFACSSDSQEFSGDFLCCQENPFADSNVDNLDQTMGKVRVAPIFTPNFDGIFDYLVIENIDLYPNNTLIILDLEGNKIYEKQEYKNPENVSESELQKVFYGKNNENGKEYPSGSYQYQLVIENEQVYSESGYFCLIRGKANSDLDLNACQGGIPDPAL